MDRFRLPSATFRRSRRRFVQGLAGSALAVIRARHFDCAAAADSPATDTTGPVLSGTDFNLEIGALPVNLTGQPGIATVVNGRLPAPLLRWREGDIVTLRVSNRLSAPTSIHWHGMILPADMDGVPGLSFDGIAPGATYVYRFKVNQSGTYWYHSHSRFQEQTGLYGPIVIEPRRGERHRTDREHVVLLSEWTDLDPEHIYRTLKRQGNYFNFGGAPRVISSTMCASRAGNRRSKIGACGDRCGWTRQTSRMSPGTPTPTFSMARLRPATGRDSSGAVRRFGCALSTDRR